MKTTLNLRNTYYAITLLFTLIVFVNCKGHNSADNKDSVSGKDKAKAAKPESRETDSVKLTELVKKLYKWHIKDTTCKCSFTPLKANSSDTLFTNIDLNDTQKNIEDLKRTTFFTQDFLNDYRSIAVRMDKELKDGTSLWPDGELSTFGDDSDAWCNCQDFPVDDYWKIIKLTNIKINNNEASFKWTWGDGFITT
jgi:hypothetical protein